MKINIGTSGWHYDHWRGCFYPQDLATTDWLGFYARQFDCVEVNNSFYRFPSKQHISRWLESTPRSFRFAIKASRYITQQKKLRQCHEPLRRFLDQAESFGDRLGPILFQLPPRWRVNGKRLRAFLRLLPQDLRFAMEFRDHSWHCPEVWDLLAEYDVAWCQYDLQGFLAPERVTTDMVYMRLHGPGRDAYSGSYSKPVLRQWAARFDDWQQAGYAVWAFFDNDQAGNAPANARLARQLSADAA